MKKLIVLLVCTIIILFGYIILIKFDNRNIENGSLPYSGVKIKIVKQFSTAYAPVYIAEQLNLINKYLPGIQVEWFSLGGGVQ